MVHVLVYYAKPDKESAGATAAILPEFTAFTVGVEPGAPAVNIGPGVISLVIWTHQSASAGVEPDLVACLKRTPGRTIGIAYGGAELPPAIADNCTISIVQSDDPEGDQVRIKNAIRRLDAQPETPTAAARPTPVRKPPAAEGASRTAQKAEPMNFSRPAPEARRVGWQPPLLVGLVLGICVGLAAPAVLDRFTEVAEAASERVTPPEIPDSRRSAEQPAVDVDESAGAGGGLDATDGVDRATEGGFD